MTEERRVRRAVEEEERPVRPTRPTGKKKRRKKKASPFGVAIRAIIVAILVVVVIFAAVSVYNLSYKVFKDVAMTQSPGTSVQVNIPENASKSEVAEILKHVNLIEDEGIFKIRCILYEAEFHPGIYTLSSDMTTEEILDVLRYELITDN